MPTERWIVRYLAAASVALLFVGCASSNAPRGWLDSPGAMARQAFGGWIQVELQQPMRLSNPAGKPAPSSMISGELIAVEAESLYVLQTTLIAIPIRQIAKASLMAYDSEYGKLGGWTALGTVSTLSHGYFFVFSAPLWILAGSLSAAAQSRLPQLIYPRSPIAEMRPYARFPQGLPKSLNRANLKPKPFKPRTSKRAH